MVRKKRKNIKNKHEVNYESLFREENDKNKIWTKYILHYAWGKKKLRKYKTKQNYHNRKQQHLKDLKKKSLNFYDIHAENNAFYKLSIQLI